MKTKVLQVFYGADALPYKDKERTVHFPIVGNAIQNANNTTQIKFYFDRLIEENEQTTFVAVSKLPNGKIGSKILETYDDDELGEQYALLDLDSFYTQYKGDVFISLQGYQGGVRVEQDEQGIYQIYGTPVIAATGSIKLAINYAPSFVGSGETENVTLQQVLGELSTKLGVRQETLHVEELPTVGNPDIWYVVNDDEDDPNKQNIYIWNATTQSYIWVGDNTLDLGDYYTKEQGEQFESDIGNRVTNVENELSSVASGSPKGIYATLSDLETAYPTGTDGIYVVSADGHWYYWNGSAWTDGGAYLSTVNAVPDTRKVAGIDLQNDITVDELNDALDIFPMTPDKIYKNKQYLKENVLLTPTNVYPNSYIGSYDANLEVLISSGFTQTIKEYDVINGMKAIAISKSDVAGGNYKITFSGYWTASRPNGVLKFYTKAQLLTKDWVEETSDALILDLDQMKATESVQFPGLTGSDWANLKKCYVSVDSSSDESYANILYEYDYSIDDFKWLKESNDCEIIVPKKWITCTGIEFDFYKENCLLGRYINDVHLVNFAVTDGTRNVNWYQDRYRSMWIPRADMITDRKISLYKYNQYDVTIEKTISCISVDKESASGRTIKALIIGDSKVAGGRLVERFYNRCTNNGVTLTLLGTIEAWGMPQYKHEGHSGWAAYNFVHDASYRSVTNPFYNNGFDFSYYMTNQGYTGVDYVFINLGINDISMGYENQFIENINAMITSIHTYDPSIKIIIGMCEGLCTREYNANILNFNTKVNELHKREFTAWEDNETNNIYLCPLYISIDLYNDFDMATVPLTAIDEECNTGKTRIIVDDNTHQNRVGYYKNADLMWAMFEYIEANS